MTLTISHTIDKYLTSLSAGGKSPLTIEAYKRELDRLVDFTGNIQVSNITTNLINRFSLSDNANMMQDGSKTRSEATICRVKACLKSFCRFLEEEGHTAANMARQIRIKRTERNEPTHFTPEEKKRLIRAIAGRSGEAAERDLVIVELFLGTGIRLSELVNLEVKDIKFADKHIAITAKGGKKETRFLKTKLRNILKHWLRKRRDMISNCQALFLSNRRARITARQIERRFTHWLDWADIDNTNRKLTVHSMRHYFATNLYGQTRNLVLVSKALGHRQISTTKIYTHLFDHELEDAIEDMA